VISTPSLDDYAVFCDLEVSDLSTYALPSLEQGVDLMWLATSLTTEPTDAQELRILQRGIMAMAEALEVSKGYRAHTMSPYSSETIGSYSYMKVATAVRAGIPTGLLWFDVAVSHFSGTAEIQNTATALFDRMPYPPAEIGLYYETDGSPLILGPADMAYVRTYTEELE
jgi:hypothetical protein